jgi:hypothetical protein
MLDSKKYEILWMRWTVVDWVLGLLAAGTAITAAMKNAFTTHSQAAAVAAAAAANPPSSVSLKVDMVVMIFAVLTIVATTLDAKMHAAQSAERYRRPLMHRRPPTCQRTSKIRRKGAREGAE